MQKLKFLLLALLTVSIFTACSDDDDSKNVIGEKYFTIENAKYSKNDLPSGNADFISNVHMNGNVINGGSTIITFTSSEKITKAYVNVRGEKGHYEVPFNQTQLRSTQETTEYDYEILLMINQNINVESFIISMSATSVDGRTNEAIESGRITVIEAGIGDLQISLSWDKLDDVDLHVFDPDGYHIYYNNRFISYENVSSNEFYFYLGCYLVTKYTDHDASNLDYNNSEDIQTLNQYKNDLNYDDFNESEETQAFIKTTDYKAFGYLDIDSNPGCNIDGVNNENIFFYEPKAGEYTIAVDLYAKCYTAEGAKYSVTLNYKGRPIQFSDNQTGQFDESDRGSGNNPAKYVTIGTFTVEGTRSSQVKSADTESEFTKSFKERLFFK